MKRLFSIVFFAAYSNSSAAQPAKLEVEGVFGECNPVWAAAQDQLLLYREPDLRSSLGSRIFLFGLVTTMLFLFLKFPKRKHVSDSLEP
jgi:hypothetical protein